jgi:hypothetical protein
MSEVLIDEEFSQMLLDALIDEQNERPRSNQSGLGPSEIGGCREYVRASIAGDERAPEPRVWRAAAEIGTILGDNFEQVFGRRLNGTAQVSLTATLPRTGITVTGSSDTLFKNANVLIDLKSKDGLATIRREGPSLENMIQTAVYALGAVQMGLLTEGALAYLVYYDRAGADAKLIAIPVQWDALMKFIDVLEDRLMDVVAAQLALDEGNGALRWGLRDKPPSWCFSEKVLCPFRMACWRGSDWTPSGAIEHDDEIDAVRRYVEARDEAKDVASRSKVARDDLIGIEGVTPDGWIVGWAGNRISVTRLAD